MGTQSTKNIEIFKSIGVLEYYESGWIILRCCEDLAKYYRRGMRIKALAAPPFGAHVTVVNGKVEDPTKSKAWKAYEGQDVEFEYEGKILSLEGYYWISVTCDRLLDIREELGLKRDLKFPLHLTVAKER